MADRWEPYSVKQRRKELAGAPVIYEYEKILKPLRAQVMYGLQLAARAVPKYDTDKYWWNLGAQVAAEHGYIDGLSSYRNTTYQGNVKDYVGKVRKIDYLLDVVDIGLYLAYRLADEHSRVAERRKARTYVDDAVEEINYRFKLNAVGYQYVGTPGEIIRIDTQYVHAEAVEPAILQLHAAGWDGPLAEFLSAHKHYRRGEHKAAMNDALNAFESTMKAILAERECEFDPNGQARHLITALIDNHVIPSSLGNYMHALRTILESGVPMLRNKLSGHGQGQDVVEVPGYVSAFTLNLTASNIVFLMDANGAHNRT